MFSLIQIIKSYTVKREVKTMVENAIGAFLNNDPCASIKLIEEIKSAPVRIRDGIYWENFEEYLLHVYDFDETTGRLNDNNKRKLKEMLAQDTPNPAAGYKGNMDRLRENAKRLVLLIDNAGTVQKSIYYANLTRALLNELISVDKFFKLCYCINSLTEEDLEFFADDIQKMQISTITTDRENIDDFRSVGLLREVENGFFYTLRAFELLKYGLKYEEDIQIPNNIQERMTIGTISEDFIEELVNS